MVSVGSLSVFGQIDGAPGLRVGTTNVTIDPSAYITYMSIEDVQAIEGLTDFHVLKDGTMYMMRFSLIDKNGYAAASDAIVVFGIYDKNLGNINYRDVFGVNASDFGEYKLALTGQPFIAYVWQEPESQIEKDHYCNKEAKISVMLPDGRAFETEDTIYE